jgi:hypothetical protein
VKAHRQTHESSVGSTVEVRYEIIDAEHVRILEYRRKPRGGSHFRRVKTEEGRVVHVDQLPFEVPAVTA